MARLGPLLLTLERRIARVAHDDDVADLRVVGEGVERQVEGRDHGHGGAARQGLDVEERLVAVLVAVAIGDVSGHGLSTGLVMAMVKAAMATLVEEGAEETSLFHRLNELVYRSTERRAFMTLGFTIFDLEKSDLEVKDSKGIKSTLHQIFVDKVGPEAAVAERREGDAA